MPLVDSSWRYVPMYRELGGARSHALVGVCLDANNRLVSVDEFEKSSVIVGDLTDLVKDLIEMLSACTRYDPICYDTVQHGMIIEENDSERIKECQEVVSEFIDDVFPRS